MREERDVERIAREIRSSIVYENWVRLNKSVACHNCLCDDQTKLELHHNPDFYTLIRNEYRIHQNWEVVKQSLIAKHANNSIDHVTFCKPCHTTFHGGRLDTRVYTKTDPQVHLWCALPRCLEKLVTRFSYSRKDKDPSSLGLIPFQVILGIGWHVLNDEITDQTVVIDVWKFARLIGKRAGTSWRKSFFEALERLKSLGFLDEYSLDYENSRQFKLKLGELYVKEIKLNPWFMLLKHTHTNNMLTMVMTWYLCTKQRKPRHEIYIKNLVPYLGVIDKRQDHLAKRVEFACRKVAFVKTVEVKEGPQGKKFRFMMNLRNAAIPVHTLRKKLVDL